MRLCSDVDGTCCDTPVLSSSFADDWSKNDNETWKEKYFGPCKNFKLKVKRGLSVSLVKANPDNPLTVNSIDILAHMANNTNKNVTKKDSVEQISFACVDPKGVAFNFPKKGGEIISRVLLVFGPSR